MEISAFSCSLEKMIGFISKINGVEMLRFVLYTHPRYYSKKKETRRYIEFSDVKKFIDGKIKFDRFFKKEYDEILGMTSLVKIGGETERHIPMIDFECAISGQNLLRVLEVLGSLDQKEGFILESGASYHYYGIELISFSKWVAFMKRCESYDIIGSKWISHQLKLKENCSTLRISVAPAKPHLPEVIAKIGDFEI